MVQFISGKAELQEGNSPLRKGNKSGTFRAVTPEEGEKERDMQPQDRLKEEDVGLVMSNHGMMNELRLDRKFTVRV